MRSWRAGILSCAVAIAASAGSAAPTPKSFAVSLPASWFNEESGSWRETWRRTSDGRAALSITVLKNSSTDIMPRAAGTRELDATRRLPVERFARERRGRLSRIGIKDWAYVRHEDNELLTADRRRLAGVWMDGFYRTPAGDRVCFSEWQVKDERGVYQVLATEPSEAACDWAALRRLFNGFRVTAGLR